MSENIQASNVGENKIVDKKIILKNFIIHHRKLKTCQGCKIQTFQQLRKYIVNQDVQQFSKLLQKQDNQTLISFLLSQNNFKQIPMIQLINNQNMLQFIDVINKWSFKQYKFIKEQVIQQIKNNQITDYLWKKIFQNFHKSILNRYTVHPNLLKQTEGLVQQLTKPQTIFYALTVKYLKLDLLQLYFKNLLNPKIIQRIYLQICKKLVLNNPSIKQVAKQFDNFLSYSIKKDVWDHSSFLNNLNMCSILKLYELNYNVMHELVQNGKMQEIIKVYEAIENKAYQSLEFEMFQKQMMNSFNISQQTPTDMCLRLWKYDKINSFLTYIQTKNYIYLSVNCINKVLQNWKLNQTQVQHIIIRILQGNLGYNGYAKIVANKFSGKYRVPVRESTFKLEFNTKVALMQVSSHSSYPLLNYLNRFREKCSKNILQKLFLKNLGRKSMKVQISAILTILEGKSRKIVQGSMGEEQVEHVLIYYQPLLTLLIQLPHSQILDFLIDKTYINHLFIKKYGDLVELTNRHFLTQYIDNNAFIGQDQINTKIFQHIFKCQKKIIGNIKMYNQLLCCVNRSNKCLEDSQWLPVMLRQELNKYFDSFSSNQLIQDTVFISNQQNHLLCDELSWGWFKQIDRHEVFWMKQKQESGNEKVSHQWIKAKPKQSFQTKKFLWSKQKVIKKLSQFPFRNLFETLKKQYENNHQQLKQDQLFKLRLCKKVLLQIDPQEYSSDQQKFGIEYNFQYFRQKYLLKPTLKNLKKLVEKNLQSEYRSKIQLKAQESELEDKVSLLISNKMNCQFRKRSKVNHLKHSFKDKTYESILRRMLQLPCDLKQSIQYCDSSETQNLSFIENVDWIFESISHSNKKSVFYFLLFFAKRKNQISYQKSDIYEMFNYNLDFHIQLVMEQLSSLQVENDLYNKYNAQLQQYINLKVKHIGGLGFNFELEQAFIEEKFSKIVNILVKHAIKKRSFVKKIVLKFAELCKYCKKKLDLLILVLNFHQKSVTVFKQYLQLTFKTIKDAQNGYLQNNYSSSCLQTRLMFFDWLQSQTLENLNVIFQLLFTKDIVENHSNLKHLKYNILSYKTLLIHLRHQDIIIIMILRCMKLGVHFSDSFLYYFYVRVKWTKLTTFVMLMLQKKTYNILLEGKQDTIINFNQITAFVKCNIRVYEIILQNIQLFISLTSISEELKLNQLLFIVRALSINEAWDRLQRFFLIKFETKYANELTFEAIEHIGSSFQRNKSFTNDKFFESLIKRLFLLLQECQWQQNIFILAFCLRPTQTFKFYPPKNKGISVLAFQKCLRVHPIKAAQFINVTVNENQQQEFLKQSKYPILPCYTYDFQSKPWLLDILRIEAKLHLKSFNSRRMQTFYSVSSVRNKFDQFYIKTDQQKFCKAFLNSSRTSSLKELPLQWFKEYFKKHQIRKFNLEILQESLILQLIQQQFINMKNIRDVVKSSKLKCFEKMLQKHRLIFGQSLIETIALQCKENNFWKMLFSIANEQFVISFMQKYCILKNFAPQKYAESLFLQICSHRRNKLLRYITKYFSELYGKLSYHFSQKGSIQNNQIMLPEIAWELNYYEYYFLVKQSNNKCPTFFTSSRFLINLNPEDYHFIPLMYHRLKILSKFKEIFQKNCCSENHINFFMPHILQLQLRKQQFQIQYYKSHDSKWLESLRYVIQSILKGQFQYDRVCFKEVYLELLAVILSPNTKIPQAQLINCYPTQMEQITAFIRNFKLTPTKIDLKNVIENNQHIAGLLLLYNPQLYLSLSANFFSDNYDITIQIYIRGIETQLGFFEQKQPQILTQYIDKCFLNRSKDQKYQYLIKHQFILCILSYSNYPNRKTLNQFKQHYKSQSDSDQSFLMQMYQAIGTKSEQVCDKISEIIQKAQQLSLKTGNTNCNLQKIKDQLNKNYGRILNQKIVSMNFQFVNFIQFMKIILKSQLDPKTSLTNFHFTVLLNASRMYNIIKQFYNTNNLVDRNFQQKVKLILHTRQFSNQRNLQKFEIKCDLKKSSNFCVKIDMNHCNDYEKLKYIILIDQQYFKQWQREISSEQSQNLNQIYIKIDQESFRKNIDKKQQMDELRNHNIKQQLSLLNDQIQQWNRNHYSLSDVDSPFPVTEQNFNQIIENLALFQIPFNIMLLMSKVYKLKNLKNIPNIQQQQKTLLQNWNIYQQYFSKHLMNQSQQIIPNNTLYLNLNCQTADILRTQLYTYDFFPANIINILKTFQYIQIYTQNPIRQKIKISMCINSILNIIYDLRNKYKNGILYEIQTIFNSICYLQLLNYTMIALVKDWKLIEVIKYIVVKWKKQTKFKQNYFKISQEIAVQDTNFNLNNQILIITFQIIIIKNSNKQNKSQISKLNNSRKQFLSSILQTQEMFTNYLLKRQKLDQECLNVATQLTSILNCVVNVNIDYRVLYRFIGFMKKNQTVDNIEFYLLALGDYITRRLKTVLIEHIDSDENYKRQKILILDTFQNIEKRNSQRSLKKIENLSYQTKFESEKVLQEIQLQVNEDQLIKNVFLIQIFKSYFKTMSYGKHFLVGDENEAYVINRQDSKIDQIDKYQYAILVTPVIPSPMDISYNQIIRIFITDSHSTIYQINQKNKQYLLNGQQQNHFSIPERIPIIPPNIQIGFSSQQLLTSNLALNQSVQYLKIQLKNQSDFKLLPQPKDQISLLNSLKISEKILEKKTNLIEKLKNNFSKNLCIIFRESDQIKLNQEVQQAIIKAIQEFQFCIDNFVQNINRYVSFETCISVEKEINIAKDYSIQLRKEIFLTYFNAIQFIVVNCNDPKVSLIQQKIIIQISPKSLIRWQETMIIIAQKLIQKQLSKKFEFKKPLANIKVQYKEEKIISNLLKIVDLINMYEQQINEIQSALQIYYKLKKKQILVQAYQINITKNKKMTLSLNNGILSILFNFQEECDLYTISDILQFLLVGSNNFSKSLNFSTKFNISENKIEVYGIQVQNVTLILYNKNNIKIENKKIILENIVNGYIELKANKQKEKYKYFIINENNNICYNYIYLLPQKQQQQNIIYQKKHQGKLNQIFKLYLQSSLQINIQKCKYIFKIISQQNQNQYNSLFTKYIELKLLSKQICQYKIKIYQLINLKIYLEKQINIFSKQKYFELLLLSDNKLYLENTKFQKIQFRNKSIIIEKSNLNLKHIFSQPIQIQCKIKQKKKQRSLESMIYSVNSNDRKYLTKAGQIRIDYIQLCDSNHHKINYQQQLQIWFQHIHNVATIQPEITNINGQLALKWMPIIRGQYLMFINGIRINSSHEIGVCAGVAIPFHSKVTPPKVNKMCYNEQKQFIIEFKDDYNNIYSQLEDSMGQNQLSISANGFETEKIKLKKQKIDNYGKQILKFSVQAENIEKTVELKLFMNLQEIFSLLMTFDGLVLSQRHKILKRQIQKIQKITKKDVKITRQNFLQNMFEIAQNNMHKNFRVNFNNQYGIDEGGLVRQFYSLIGKEIISEKNHFFNCINQTKQYYFLDPVIRDNKKRQQYMKLFGKYLANSILNDQLICMCFSPTFIKLLYQDKIDYNDLFAILKPEELKSYSSLLNYEAEDLEDLEIYFSITEKDLNKIVELKENGANIQVNKSNVKEYLNLLAKQKLYIRYEECFKSFIEGFNSVISLELIKKWIKYDQFWILTNGVQEITPQLIINITQFRGKCKDMYIGWFKRYLKQCDRQLLLNFMQFTTGCSSLKLGKKDNFTVIFQDDEPNSHRLPISHTCWNQIIIPKYKTYEIMKDKLNCAFLQCAFGFANA